jgi:two-component system, cell cycle sensor histidine kinase and response regulator CckA
MEAAGPVVTDERLRAVGLLAGPVAHDVANLMMAVLAAADTIEARPGVDELTREDARAIRTGVLRGAALLRRLLSPEAARPEKLALNDAVRDTASLLRRLLPGRIRLELDLTEAGPVVWANPGEFDRALLNLAINARAAMPDGGVLALRTSVPADAGVAWLEVADSGAGMAPEVLARAFEPGFTTRGGHGLGLASVRSAMAACGGSVTLHSVSGAGTTARLILPLARPVARPPVAGAGPQVRGVVLLVEDDAVLRAQASAALGRAGWRVLAAESGEQALALADGGGVDAVMADYGLPGIDGAALMLALRLRLQSPDLPGVLVSGYALAAPAPGIAVLAKPCGTGELVAALAGATGGVN